MKPHWAIAAAIAVALLFVLSAALGVLPTSTHTTVAGAPAPTTSGPATPGPETTTAYAFIVNAGLGTVSVINTASPSTVIHALRVASSGSYSAMNAAYDSVNDYLYVTNGGNITVCSTTTWTCPYQLTSGVSAADYVVFDYGTNQLFATNDYGGISAFSLVTPNPSGYVDIANPSGLSLNGIAYDPVLGEVFAVGQAHSGGIGGVSGADDATPASMTYTDDALVISDANDTVVHTISLDSNLTAQSIVYDPAYGEMFVAEGNAGAETSDVAQVQVITDATNTISATILLNSTDPYADFETEAYSAADGAVLVADAGGSSESLFAVSDSNNTLIGNYTVSAGPLVGVDPATGDVYTVVSWYWGTGPYTYDAYDPASIGASPVGSGTLGGAPNGIAFGSTVYTPPPTTTTPQDVAATVYQNDAINVTWVNPTGLGALVNETVYATYYYGVGGAPTPTYGVSTGGNTTFLNFTSVIVGATYTYYVTAWNSHEQSDHSFSATATVLYGYYEHAYTLPNYAPLEDFVCNGPIPLNPPYNCNTWNQQEPTLTSTGGTTFGVYYVQNSTPIKFEPWGEFVEYYPENNTVRDIANVTLLSQQSGFYYPGEIDNEFALPYGANEALFFGDSPNNTPYGAVYYSIELVNLTTGQVLIWNTTGGPNGLLTLGNDAEISAYYIGNNTVIVSIGGYLEGYDVATDQEWAAGTTEFNGYTNCMGIGTNDLNQSFFEANNMYWVPQLNSFINIEAAHARANCVQQLVEYHYPPNDSPYFATVNVINDTTGTGAASGIVNFVNGIAYNPDPNEIAFSTGCDAAQYCNLYGDIANVYLYTHVISIVGGVISLTNIKDYTVCWGTGSMGSGCYTTTGGHMDMSGNVYTGNYFEGSPLTAYSAFTTLYDPWNNTTIETNRSLTYYQDPADMGQDFEGQYPLSPAYMIDASATSALSADRYYSVVIPYVIVYACHSETNCFPYTAPPSNTTPPPIVVPAGWVWWPLFLVVLVGALVFWFYWSRRKRHEPPRVK